MSRARSLARSVAPLRCRVASATCGSGIAGFVSSEKLDLAGGELGHLPGDLLEPLLDVLAQLIGDGHVPALDLDLHGAPLVGGRGRHDGTSRRRFSTNRRRAAGSRVGDRDDAGGAAPPQRRPRRRRAWRRSCADVVDEHGAARHRPAGDDREAPARPGARRAEADLVGPAPARRRHAATGRPVARAERAAPARSAWSKPRARRRAGRAGTGTIAAARAEQAAAARRPRSARPSRRRAASAPRNFSAWTRSRAGPSKASGAQAARAPRAAAARAGSHGAAARSAGSAHREPAASRGTARRARHAGAAARSRTASRRRAQRRQAAGRERAGREAARESATIARGDRDAPWTTPCASRRPPRRLVDARARPGPADRAAGGALRAALGGPRAAAAREARRSGGCCSSSLGLAAARRGAHLADRRARRAGLRRCT